MPKFVPGLKLSKLFYRQQVRPILNREFPTLRYSAAVIGWGSEVLGFDTPMSRDHHWGPRVLLFLSEKDYTKLKDVEDEGEMVGEGLFTDGRATQRAQDYQSVIN